MLLIRNRVFLSRFLEGIRMGNIETKFSPESNLYFESKIVLKQYISTVESFYFSEAFKKIFDRLGFFLNSIW